METSRRVIRDLRAKVRCSGLVVTITEGIGDLIKDAQLKDPLHM